MSSSQCASETPTSLPTAKASSEATSIHIMDSRSDKDGKRGQPRKRGIAKKRVVVPKRRWIDRRADNDFVVPDDTEEETRASKSTKRTAAPKVVKTIGTKVQRKEHTMSALDRAQKAEELRLRKKRVVSKFEAVVKKHDDLIKATAINSAADLEIKSQNRKRVTLLPPAVSSGRRIDAEIVNKKTPSELRALNQSRIEETDGVTTARMETDPNDSQIKIVYLARCTKQIPIFPNVYAELSNIIAAPHSYPHVEVNMEAGEFGVIRIRRFKAGMSDPSYKQLAEGAPNRHKHSSRSREGRLRPDGARRTKRSLDHNHVSHVPTQMPDKHEYS